MYPDYEQYLKDLIEQRDYWKHQQLEGEKLVKEKDIQIDTVEKENDKLQARINELQTKLTTYQISYDEQLN